MARLRISARLVAGHRVAYYATIALLPYWWHVRLWGGSELGVFYFYDSVLLFASDAALVVCLLLWSLMLLLRHDSIPKLGRPWWATGPLALLALAALGSSAVSPLPAVSLYFSTHLLLLGLQVVYTIHERPRVQLVAAIFGVNLLVQAGLAALQLGTQTTFPLGSWFLGWPQELPAAQPGAAVVQTAEDARWLRAYGSFPHPNVLGGYLAATLVLAAGWYAARPRPFALAATLLAGLLSVLAFSRGGWIGGVAGGCVLAIIFSSYAQRGLLLHRLLILVIALALLWGGLGLLFGDLLFTRLADQSAPLEGRSTAERHILEERAGELLQLHPLTGVGAGASVVVQQRAGLPDPPEPVHLLPLLVLVEAGPLGLAAWGLQVLVLVVVSWRRRTASDPWLAAFAAALVALLAASLFDHYLWSMAPARTLFWALWGLWASRAVAGPPTTVGGSTPLAAREAIS